MLLVELAWIVLISYTEVEASFARKTIPVSRIERPTKSSSRVSRSRVVLTTTPLPRTPEDSNTGRRVFESHYRSSDDPSSPPSRKKSSLVLPSGIIAEITPSRLVEGGIVGVSQTAHGEGGSGDKTDGTSHRSGARRLVRSLTSRVLSFYPHVSGSQETHSRGARFNLAETPQSDEEDPEYSEEEAETPKRRRVSTLPERITPNPETAQLGGRR
jgi:hypothetical protein